MICEKKKCTGCSACLNICPKNAIKMIPDDYGNIYPTIDKAKCINCNLCKTVCPQINNINLEKPKKCFAASNSSKSKRSKSSSGGIASILYEFIISVGGVGYGVSSNLSEGLCFKRIESIKEIDDLKGSKYVHCYVNDIYKKVKKDLNNQEKVLFIGTPCQIAGLKKFLMKEYENLITVDIICHGVPSQKFLIDELKYNNINPKKVTKISFRNNNKYIIRCLDSENKEEKIKESLYLNEFLKCNIMRENCYSCQYANINRCSDITIGDFWGLHKDSKLYKEKESGVSVVLINTPKGSEIINKIKLNCILEERSIKEAQNGNNQLRRPGNITKGHKIYLENYANKGYAKTKIKLEKNKTIKEKLKEIQIVYNLYKKVKGKNE